MRTKRKAAAGAAALATAVAFIAPMAVGATAASAATGANTPIQHLVVIFQENVSFDHYFGTYPNAAGFTPKAGTPSVNGLTPALLTSNPNSAQPQLYANTESAASGLQSLLTCDQDHNYADEQTAFDGGLMDKFVQSVGTGGTTKDEVTGAVCNPNEVMNYYDGTTVTGLWNYAQQFAMSDNSFGTTFGPSAPGAINVVSGDTGNVDTTGCTALPTAITGCAHMAGAVSIATSTSPNADLTADGAGGYSLTSDAQPFYDDCSTRDAVALTGTNVGDLLSKAGISWGWFQGGFAPTTSYATASGGAPTGTFIPDQFNNKFTVTGVPNATALGGGTTTLNQGICNSYHDIGADLPAPNTGTGQWGAKGDYIAHHEPFQFYATTANPHHLAPASLAVIGTDTQSFTGGTYGSGSPNWDTANHQYDLSNFDALVAAAAQGQTDSSSADGKYHLPAVSFLKAAGFEDGHAQYSDPIDEQNFVTREINALMQTPDWPSTAVLLNYDDSDGWYDHAYASSSTGGALVPLNPSSSVADNLFNSVAKPYTAGASGSCTNTGQGQVSSSALAGEQGRCGLGPRLPMMAISCLARSNYVDHALSDQSSITKFIQGNWGLPAITGSVTNLAYNGTASNATYDAEGPLSNLFDFTPGATDTAGCSPYYLDVHTGAPTTVPNPVLPDSRTPALFVLTGLVVVGFVVLRHRTRRSAS